MATIGYAELPVPGGAQAPLVPADIAELAESVDPHLKQHAINQADRDSRFASAPVQTLVIAQNGTTWVKTSAGNTWATLWEPIPDWINITLLAGYTASAGYTPQARIRDGGRRVSLRGRIERTDGQVIPTNGVKIGSVPSSCIPQVQPGQLAVTCSLAGDVTIGTGKLEILEVGTSSALGSAGDLTWWSQDGATAGGVPWIGINGDYWTD